MDRDSFAMLHPLRVRWNECDMHGIVFNVNYFLYYDIATYEWQCAVGDAAGGQPDFLTAHAECDYMQAATFNDALDVGVRCVGIGQKSINLETAVFRGGELLNRGRLTYVHLKKGTTETSVMAPDLIERILAF